MIEWQGALSGLVLFFVLGLRHGIEPDHVAAIDGMTLRAFDRHESHAAWTGSLFALGHGLAIAALATAVSLMAAAFTPAPWLVQVLDILPLLLLTGLGLWNLRALLAPGTYRPTSMRMQFLPARLRERSDLLGTVAIGVVFALVVDTVAHISAWSVFATQRGGWRAGALAGALFSVGMLVASTLDSQFVALLLRRSQGEAQANRMRRALGWVVVAMSFGVVGWAIAERLRG